MSRQSNPDFSAIYKLFDYDDALAPAMNYIHPLTYARRKLGIQIKKIINHTLKKSKLDTIKQHLSQYFTNHPLTASQDALIDSLKSSTTPQECITATHALSLQLIHANIHSLILLSQDQRPVTQVFPASTRINRRIDRKNYLENKILTDSRYLRDDLAELQKMPRIGKRVNSLTIHDIREHLANIDQLDTIVPTALIEGENPRGCVVEESKAWHIALWCQALAKQSPEKPILVEFLDDSLRDPDPDEKEHPIRDGMRFLCAHPELIPETVALRCITLDGFSIEQSITNGGAQFLQQLKHIIAAKPTAKPVEPAAPPFDNPKWNYTHHTIQGKGRQPNPPLAALSQLIYTKKYRSPRMSDLSGAQLTLFKQQSATKPEKKLRQLQTHHQATLFIEDVLTRCKAKATAASPSLLSL